MFELNGRTALVTGAARGIGLEAARTLANCGAAVWLADIDEPELKRAVDRLRSAGLKVSGSVLDATSPEAWKSVVGDIQKASGRLDILVNSAGICLTKPFLNITLEDFRRTMAVNVESVFIGTQAVFSLMAETAKLSESGCSIINVSSTMGLVASSMASAYCASKGAIRLLTKALAVEFGYGGANIRVNSVHPGAIDTDMSKKGFQTSVDLGLAPDIATVVSAMNRSIPMGRMGQAAEVAGAIAFLASDASKYMNGAEVVVDGGCTAV